MAGAGCLERPQGATTLHAFDDDTEDFGWHVYVPADPIFTLVSSATVEWDPGSGADCRPGRLKVVVPFTNWNQLADLEVALSPARDLSGKILRAYVELVSGGSSNPSCPAGTYLYVFTGDDDVWGRGSTIDLTSSGPPGWNRAVFTIEVPSQNAAAYDPTEVTRLGMQFYSNSGSGCSELPTTLVVYLDEIELVPAL